MFCIHLHYFNKRKHIPRMLTRKKQFEFEGALVTIGALTMTQADGLLTTSEETDTNVALQRCYEIISTSLANAGETIATEDVPKQMDMRLIAALCAEILKFSGYAAAEEPSRSA